MAAVDFSHGGDIYAVEEAYKKEVIDFSASINPLGLSTEVKRAICRSLNKIRHYPDTNNREITRHLAKYWGIKGENILIGNGSVELIYLIVQAFMPQSVSIIVPSFSEYERASRLVRSKINFVTLSEKDGFRFCRQNRIKSDILFLCNPNNPTGNLLLEKPPFIKKLPAELNIVDESFIDFLKNEDKYSLVNKCVSYKNVIVLRSFTKFFALAGLRIGYLTAHKRLIQKLKDYRIPWQVNVLAEKSACAALAGKEYRDRTRRFIEKERNFLFGKIAAIRGLKPYPSTANFILTRIYKADLTSSSLRERLIHKGILIRDCANFRGLDNKFIRVAVRSRRENLCLITALRESI